jgi:glutathione S-transferase
MPDLHLITGNRNYSSWSLRPWLLLKHLGLEFRESRVPLDTPEFRGQLQKLGNPSGRVPALQDGELVIWDSLAICEYLAELTGRGWPTDRAARAIARAVSAEMHSGFSNLRSAWPFNARARDRHTAMTPGLKADIDRIEAIWADCRDRFGESGGGPWLFGQFSIADAMYAPVVLRFNTYGAPLTQGARSYVATTLEAPAMQEWLLAARNEKEVLTDYEIR